MKNKSSLLSLIFISLALTAQAQISTHEAPTSFALSLSNYFQKIELQKPNIDSLEAVDAVEEKQKDIPWRFGFGLTANFSLSNSGTWTTLTDGDKIWRLEISSPGALSLNINYSVFDIPKGAKFFVYTPNKSDVLGAYTSKNENPDGRFATKPTHGDKVILEYYEPQSQLGKGRITISDVVYGYKSLFDKVKDFGSSGSCNINVICDSDKWSNEARAVAMLLTSGNSRFCSGSLVNNTRNDGTPYVLTANHCNPATNSIFMFRYQSPSCSTNIDGPTNFTMQGCTVKANNAPSDFFLVELDAAIPASYNVFFAGWSAVNTPAWHTTVIHHPEGDIAKISFDFKPVVSTGYYSAGNTHWEVTSYDQGTTEPGSSGSPLFNAYHQIIGQLHGGDAACGNNSFDYYGKFVYSWNTDPDTTKQLKYWLDPDSTGVTSLGGYDPNGSAFTYNAAALDIIGLNHFSCVNPSSAKLIIRNLGNTNLTSLEIHYKIDGGADSVLNWTGNLSPYGTEAVALNLSNTTGGYHQISAFVKYPNGNTDQNMLNNYVQTSFIYNNASHKIAVTVHTDDYGSETSWDIKDSTGNIFAQAGSYPDVSGGGTYHDTLCLFDNCFDFTLHDAYGDGFCCSYGNGWALLIDVTTGDTLSFDTTFGSSDTTTHFCLGDSCQMFLSAIVSPPDSGQSDGDIDLHVLGGGNYTYQWSNGDTTQDLANVAAGTYQVVVHDGSCSDTLNVVLPVSTGIQAVKNENSKIFIYPNPGKNQLYIKSDNNLKAPLNISISNILGQQVYKTTMTGKRKEINISSFSSGIYIIKIYNEVTNQSFKYIKE